VIDRPARPGDYRGMSFARWALILPIVWGVQVGAQETAAPTPLEQALIEHVCNASRVAGAVESGAYQSCLSLKLASIRADFGPDLSKLSVSDRKTIDAACSKVLETRDRDAYVECLSGQLTALSSRRRSATPAPSPAAPLPPPTSASSPTRSSPPEVSSPSSLLRIGFGLAIVLAGAGGAFIIMRRRRTPTAQPAPSTCRVCGTAVPQAGGLCERCRREAADAARRASAERVDQVQKNLEELRQQKARQEEDARQREQQRVRQQQEEARHQEEEANHRRLEEARRREAEARRASPATAPPSGDEFDPYAILGVSRDSTTEQIRAAYDEAMSKYDLTHVDHLGPELQEHYKTKAQAVERAFLMLTR
jgi:DnaJ-domain-containing protein 1